MRACAPVTASLLPVSGVALAEHDNAAMAPELSLLGGGGEELRLPVAVGVWEGEDVIRGLASAEEETGSVALGLQASLTTSLTIFPMPS